MTQHTPGPWELDWSQGYGINRGDRHIALVSFYREKPGDKEENEANAHLIAAAPELLEALEGVLRVANRKTVEFDAARAAIAKARCQSQKED